MLFKIILLAIVVQTVSGCSATQMERNMNCFAGKISGAMNVVANSINNTVLKVRSCKRIKKSKESGGVSSYTHKDIAMATNVKPVGVSPGGKIISTICYEVKTSGQGANVTERRILQTASGQSIPISNEQVYRENGFWESVIDVQIPKNQGTGNFSLISKINYNNVKLNEKYTFTVVNREELEANCGDDPAS